MGSERKTARIRKQIISENIKRKENFDKIFKIYFFVAMLLETIRIKLFV